MNHVTNHSPGFKVFKKYFIMFMMITTMISYIYHCGNSIIKRPGEEIKQHDIKVQSRFTAGVSDILDTQIYFGKHIYMLSSLRVIDINVLMQKNQFEEEDKRKKVFYYVNDEGHKSYLDKDYQDYLYAMCIKYDVEKYYTLFLAQMYHESTFQANVISATNDYGLMQINVYNHEWLSEELDISNFLDPYDNIKAGVFMMSNFLHKYNDVEKALICYNEGEGAVINGTYSTTYSKSVLSDMDLLIELS